MNSKNLVWKSQKLAFFWTKKGIFWPVPEKKIGTPTLHENRIRGLENASIDLKIGMHVPWDILKKSIPTDFWYQTPDTILVQSWGTNLFFGNGSKNALFRPKKGQFFRFSDQIIRIH